MWQILREEIAKANGEVSDTSFQMKNKEGHVVTYKNLDDLEKEVP